MQTSRSAGLNLISDDELFGTGDKAKAPAAAPAGLNLVSDDELFKDVAPAAQDRTWGEAGKDMGIKLAQGVVQGLDSATGLVNLATFGGVRKAQKALGLNPDAGQEIVQDLGQGLSDKQKQAEQNVDDAKGFVGTAKALVQNPTAIAGGVMESLPTMVLPGGGARAMMGSIVERATAKALAGGATREAAEAAGKAALEEASSAVKIAWASHAGEGLETAGGIAQQSLQANPDDESKMYWGVPAGFATAVIGRLAGKVPGFGDAEAALLSGNKHLQASGNTLTRIGKGAVQEGLFQETPQSAQEQMFTNLATNKLVMEGVGEAAAQGLIVGGAMGAGEAGIHNAVHGEDHGIHQPTATEVAAVGDVGAGAAPQPTPTQVFAQSAFADVGGDESFQAGQQRNQGTIALALNQIAEHDGEQGLLKAIDHLSGDDQDLADNLYEAAKSPELLQAGREALDHADHGVLGFTQFNDALRTETGLAEPTVVQQQTAAPQPATTPQTNSAGFVPEPLPQLQAQVAAVREGRKPGAVIGLQEAEHIDLNGLQHGVATGPDGKQALIVARDPQTVQQAVQRASEVGLEQANGELLGVVEPTATTDGAPKAVVQHVDNGNGQVIHEEAVTPERVGEVQQTPGTTTRIVPVSQVLADRQAANPVRATMEVTQGGATTHTITREDGTQEQGAGPAPRFFARAPATPKAAPKVQFKEAKQSGAARQMIDRLNASLGLQGDEQVSHESIREVQPSGPLARMAAGVQTAFGTKVVFVHAPDGLVRKNGETFNHFSGVADPSTKTILMNVEANHPLNILGHELAHVLEQAHPAAYDKLELTVLSRMRHHAAVALQERLRAAMQAEAGRENVGDIRREVVAEAIGEMAEDHTLWRSLFANLGEDRTLAKQLYQAVLDVIAKLQRVLTKAGYIEGIRDVATVKKAIVDAYKTWSDEHAQTGGDLAHLTPEGQEMLHQFRSMAANDAFQEAAARRREMKEAAEKEQAEAKAAEPAAEAPAEAATAPAVGTGKQQAKEAPRDAAEAAMEGEGGGVFFSRLSDLINRFTSAAEKIVEAQEVKAAQPVEAPAPEPKPEPLKVSGEQDTGFNGMTTLGQAMDHIAKTGNEFEAALARRLLPLIGDAPFRVVENGVKVPGGVPMALNGARGVQMTSKSKGIDGVWVRGESAGANQGINNETVLHEALHQATARKIGLGNTRVSAGSDLQATVSDLYKLANHVTRQFNRDENPPPEVKRLAGAAFNNPKELVAYGMTNPDIQSYLKGLEGTGRTSAWSEFVDLIRRLVGLGKEHTNALAELMDITNQIMDRTPNEATQRAEQAAVDEGLLHQGGSESASDSGVLFARNATKLASVQEMLDFTRVGKLDMELGEALERHRWSDAYMAAKSPAQRTKLMSQLGEKVVEMFVDSRIKAERWIRGLPLPETLTQRLSGDMYRSDTVRSTLEKEVTERFVTTMMRAITAASKATKISTDDVKKLAGSWMTARYVPEANRQLILKDRTALVTAQAAGDPKAIADAQQALNERLRDVSGAIGQAIKRGVAGGMNDATAAQIVRNVESHIDRKLLDAIAQPIYDMLAWKKAKDLATGKVTQTMVNSWLNSPAYVPLTGDPRFDRESSDVFSAGGNQVNQTAEQAMNGRMDSVPDDGIDAAFAATLKTINFAAMQDFKRTLNKAYQGAQAAGVDIGLTREPVTGIMRTGDDVIIYRDSKCRPNGVEYQEAHAFRFRDARIMEALKRDNEEHVNKLLKLFAVPTRWYARAVTQFMPMFAPINMVRDIWERSELLRTRQLVDAAGRKIDTGKAARASIADVINRDVWRAAMGAAFKTGGRTAVRDDLEEMIRLGGSSTSGDYLSRASSELEAAIRRGASTGARAREAVMHRVEAWNAAFEVIPSLAIYRSLKAQGMAPQDAAAATLDLMNFRKKGTAMPAVKALYVFAQPAATSAFSLAKYLSTRTGKVRFFTQTVIAMALYTMLKAAWGDDDDEELGNNLDNLGNSTVERSVPVKVGEYVLKLPVGFGPPQLAWVTAATLSRWSSGRYNATDAIGEAAKSWLKSVAPVNPSDVEISKHPVGWFAQTFTPTVLKPLTSIWADETPFGAPLTPVFKNSDKLKSEQAKRTTSPVYSDIARELHESLGVDMYPDQIKALSDGYLVGPVHQLIDWAIENPARVQRGEPGRYPFINQLVDTVNDRAQLNQIYYRVRGDMDQLHREYTSDLSDPEKRGDITVEMRKQEQAYDRFQAAEKLIGVQRSALGRAVGLDDETRAERVQAIEERADAEHRRLLVQYFAGR